MMSDRVCKNCDYGLYASTGCGYYPPDREKGCEHFKQKCNTKVMTNKEWLATLSAETWFEVVHEWLFHNYGMRWTDTRMAVMAWLETEHKPIEEWDFKENKFTIRWE